MASDSDSHMFTPTTQQLKELFVPFDRRLNDEKFKLQNIPDNVLKSASVLIPLFYKNGEIHVLLTVRTKNMPSHGGQVAFPGGMADPDDTDAIATALREAEEEVGLQPKDVDIIAVLSSYIVRPNSLVTAVLGLLPNKFDFRINPREVDLVFDLPLRRFLSSEGRTRKIFKFDAKFDFPVYHFSDFVQGRDLDTWGFSAMLCIQVALVAFQSSEKFSFYKDFVVTKENCFNIVSTQAIVNAWSVQPKL